MLLSFFLPLSRTHTHLQKESLMCADEEKKLIFTAESFSMVRAFYAFFLFFSFLYFHASQKCMTVQRGDCLLAHTITDNDFSFVSISLSLLLSSPLSTHKCLLFIHPRRKIGKKVFSSLIALWLCCAVASKTEKLKSSVP